TAHRGVQPGHGAGCAGARGGHCAAQAQRGGGPPATLHSPVRYSARQCSSPRRNAPSSPRTLGQAPGDALAGLLLALGRLLAGPPAPLRIVALAPRPWFPLRLDAPTPLVAALRLVRPPHLEQWCEWGRDPPHLGKLGVVDAEDGQHPPHQGVGIQGREQEVLHADDGVLLLGETLSRTPDLIHVARTRPPQPCQRDRLRERAGHSVRRGPERASEGRPPRFRFSCRALRGHLVEEPCDLSTHLLQIDPEVLEHVGGDALALDEEAKQEVLGAHVVVAHPPGLLEGALDDELDPRGRDDLLDDQPLVAAEDRLDSAADPADLDAQAVEDLGGHALLLVQQAEQQVFRADVRMVIALRLLLGEGDDLLGSLGEALEWVHVHLTMPGCGLDHKSPQAHGGSVTITSLVESTRRRLPSGSATNPWGEGDPVTRTRLAPEAGSTASTSSAPRSVT